MCGKGKCTTARCGHEWVDWLCCINGRVEGDRNYKYAMLCRSPDSLLPLLGSRDLPCPKCRLRSNDCLWECCVCRHKNICTLAAGGGIEGQGQGQGGPGGSSADNMLQLNKGIACEGPGCKAQMAAFVREMVGRADLRAESQRLDQRQAGELSISGQTPGSGGLVLINTIEPHILCQDCDLECDLNFPPNISSSSSKKKAAKREKREKQGVVGDELFRSPTRNEK